LGKSGDGGNDRSTLGDPLIEQCSNQILMDMKNIYEFRDNIEVSMKKMNKHLYQLIRENIFDLLPDNWTSKK